MGQEPKPKFFIILRKNYIFGNKNYISPLNCNSVDWHSHERAEKHNKNHIGLKFILSNDKSKMPHVAKNDTTDARPRFEC